MPTELAARAAFDVKRRMNMLCPVRLVSCDLRDGQQAAIATRMTTEEMLPVLSKDAWD